MSKKDSDPVTLAREESRRIWDHHCSYQWTYFPEEAKQVIQFFLSDRINGKNLDVGAGWYLYHPNSTAIDISLKGLEYNPANEKVLFDLDDVGRGKRLPLLDHSYTSATLVSVWQYLRNRKALLGELERVLVPGSEVFIVNQPGSGLQEQLVGPNTPEGILKEVTEAGYDCIREFIPFGRSENSFESVTVAIPGPDLFGFEKGVQDRGLRLEESDKRKANPEEFYDAFALWETRRVELSLRGLSTYPITKFFRDYCERLQAFADEFNKKFGKTALIFEEYGWILPSSHLIIPGEEPIPTFISFSEKRRGWPREDIEDLRKKYGVSICETLGSLESLEELERKLDGISRKQTLGYCGGSEEKPSLDQLVSFVVSVPFTRETAALQAMVRERLRKSVPNLDILLHESRMRNVYFNATEFKQRRRINDLVARKERILREGIPVIGEARFDYSQFIDYYMKKVREDINEISNPSGIFDEGD